MKKAIMYGAGNIGRGFIGQLFSQSGYEVVFIDIDSTIVERINTDKSYPIRIVEEDKSEEIIVKNVRAVNGMDTEAVAWEIADADIMATAVGVRVLPKIVNPIVEGLRKRWKKDKIKSLNILICENLLNASVFLEQLITQDMDKEEKEIFNKEVGLVETSIGRTVPIMTEEMQEGNPLRVYVEKYSELPVDKDAFRGDIPKILNMVPFAPFTFYVQRKLFMQNMGHATMAYLGFIKNYEYIWEVCEDQSIKLIVLKSLIESLTALSIEHSYPANDLLEYAQELIYRFRNKSLGDTIKRVGRDPIRKLSENDRLIGAAKLCMKNGINPVFISIGIAAGYIFSQEEGILDDEIGVKPGDPEISESKIKEAIKKYSNIKENHLLTNQIVKFYKMLKTGKPLGDIEKEGEKIKINTKGIDFRK